MAPNPPSRPRATLKPMEDEKKHEGAMIVRFFLTKTCYVLKNTLAMDTAKKWYKIH